MPEYDYNDREYIKLFRKMTKWEWYTDPNTFKLFLHCLIRANWRDGSWRGIKYKRGQFITSLSTLSKETGLTIKQVRTALKHLEHTNEVASKTTSRYRLITVVSYDLYQSEGQAEGQGKGKQRANKGQSKGNSIRIYKNNKEDKEYMAPPNEDDDDDDDDPPLPFDWDDVEFGEKAGDD